MTSPAVGTIYQHRITGRRVKVLWVGYTDQAGFGPKVRSQEIGGYEVEDVRSLARFQNCFEVEEEIR